MAIAKNSDIELEITDFTSEGSGVGHCEGMAVFVAGAAKGDTVKTHIIMAKKNYAVGTLSAIVKPSENRIRPDCPVFHQCGGCAYRHISYCAETELKFNRIREAFSRLGHIEIAPEEFLGAEEIDYYRNKAQYPVRIDAGKLKIGFFAPRSHRVIDCRACRLQPSDFTKATELIAKWIADKKISVYDERTHSGLLRHIYLRKGFATGEVMLCLVINGSRLPESESLIKSLLSEIPELKTVVLNINTADTNVILGEKCVNIYGDGYIEDILAGKRIRISPLSFYQVNRTQAQRLYAKAAEYAQLSEDDTVLDLYCGAGTIGLSVADRVKKVIGVEIIPEAVEDAKINAGINGVTNAEFICADAADAARQLSERGIHPNTVIIDPPRKGCDALLPEIIAGMEPERIVYVSCDPATLARDCAAFAQLGYETEKLTGVDMFPRTAHVETVALLSKGETA